MAEEIRQDEDMKKQFRKLVASEPVLPVLSDHPLDKGRAFKDRFELCYKLGPVFNIIRHKDTSTPTTIAIYGDWGTGKTSAMRWLEGLIKEWNETGKGKDKTDIKTIWFYPWKYHSRDDVWRGLISEVIIKGTEIKGADIKTVTKAVKQFGLFLGKGFIHTLAALKLKAGSDKAGGEAEFDLACIKDIMSEYDKNIHTEKAYLNDFENSFEQWVDETLSGNKRMVIFIDDLDRCMPQVALRVLEALKLYLNVPKLIFVVGVDKNVINPLVKNHYDKLGLDKYKSDNYLAKMFQTEVTVGPSENQVDEYLKYHLDNIAYFKEEYLLDWQIDLFKELINNLADRNPREVKRLINSAVMSGAGAEMMSEATGKETNYSFAQGLQVFFIRRILESKLYDKPRLLGSELGNFFFKEWSKIVRTNINKNENFPLYIAELQNYQNKIQKLAKEKGDFKAEVAYRNLFESILSPISSLATEYKSIIENPKYSDLLELLADERLGKLMQIEFSAEIAEITKEAEQPASKKDDGTKIKEAIAEQLRKEPSELTESDYKSIKELSLYGRGLSDISSLGNLTNITTLSLSNNQLSDISSLAKLTNITQLWLHNNQLSDISSLANLTKITKLYLHNNQLSDISVLANLTNLTKLYLDSNQLSNISSLSNLTNIIELSLGDTKISNISPLKYLKNIEVLYLGDTDIDDISPLFQLNQIQYLNIQDCKNIKNKQVDDLKKVLPELKIVR